MSCSCFLHCSWSLFIKYEINYIVAFRFFNTCFVGPEITSVSATPTVGGIVTITGINIQQINERIYVNVILGSDFGNVVESTFVSIGQQECEVLTVSEYDLLILYDSNF